MLKGVGVVDCTLISVPAEFISENWINFHLWRNWNTESMFKRSVGRFMTESLFKAESTWEKVSSNIL